MCPVCNQLESPASRNDNATILGETGKHDFLIRAGTWDRSIFETVIAGEYGNLAFAGKTVVDVGAHIGGFSVLAALRGARRVLAFEASAENHAMLAVNCESFPVVECHHAAVWRSDAGAGVLHWRRSSDLENTGGGSVIECDSVAGFLLATTEAQEVKGIPFDDIVLGLGTVDLLKIDAEGSEYPILLTSRTLDRVREIVGEYHAVSSVPESQAIPGYPEWTIQNLGQHLMRNGFVVQICDKGLQGLFRAFRKEDAKGR